VVHVCGVVDGIFTDRTDVLKDVLTARGLWRDPS
jgi:glycerophosphoryl diester phosphodiesterase